MTTIRELIAEHGARYPAMRPEDAVKLLYQREFGPGHLVQDRTGAEIRLADECAAIVPHDGLAFEDIGAGLARVHLAEYLSMGGSQAALCRAFVRCANVPRGSRSGFDAAITELRALSREGMLPFGSDELDAYLTRYAAAGYPAVHHSEAYRCAYSPAYRVVDQMFLWYHSILERIEALLTRKGAAVVAVDGMCASGKTTLAGYLAEVYGARLFHMDDYFPPPEMKTAARLSEPGGNVDYERVYDEIIAHLRDSEITYRPYDCRTMRQKPPVTIQWANVTIVEGSYSRHPFFGEPYDLTVFLSIDDELQRVRILKRNGPALYRRFVNEWIPLEHAYFSGCHVTERSNLRFRVDADGLVVLDE